MQLAHPFRVVTSSVDGDVLAVLARADKQYSPGDVQRIVGRSVRGIRLSLQRLAEQGVVLEQRTSTSVLYSLNTRHVAAVPLRALANLRSTVIERTTNRMASWDQPAAFAALFGSAVRDDMQPDSDIDLFVVRTDAVDADDPAWRRQLEDLVEHLSAWTGNDTRVLEYAELRVRQGREPVLAAITDEGVPVVGTMSWLRAASSLPTI